MVPGKKIKISKFGEAEKEYSRGMSRSEQINRAANHGMVFVLWSTARDSLWDAESEVSAILTNKSQGQNGER